MSNLFFSIIIPTYNRATFITKSINSFLKQKYKNFEIIVIDDGSTDQTRELLRQINDERIKYYFQRNLERGAARNYGFSKSKGDYINFFDSDDLAYNNHLSSAVEILKSKKLDIFHLGHHKIYNDKIVNVNNPDGILNDKILFGNIMLPISTFISREVARKFNFSSDRELSGSEDYLYWLEISKKYKIYSFKNVTSALILHSTRSMQTATGIQTEKRVKKLFEHLDKISSFSKEELRKIKGNCCLLIAVQYSLEKNIKKTISYIVNSIKNYPLYIFRKSFFVTIKNLIF